MQFFSAPAHCRVQYALFGVFLLGFSACAHVSSPHGEAVAVREKKAVEVLGEQSAIFWASLRARANEAANRAAAMWGLTCGQGFEGAARCAQFMARVVSEPELRHALQTAEILHVTVRAGSSFSYGDGWVEVDTEASTVDILVHLMGKGYPRTQ